MDEAKSALGVFLFLLLIRFSVSHHWASVGSFFLDGVNSWVSFETKCDSGYLHSHHLALDTITQDHCRCSGV